MFLICRYLRILTLHFLPDVETVLLAGTEEKRDYMQDENSERGCTENQESLKKRNDPQKKPSRLPLRVVFVHGF